MLTKNETLRASNVILFPNHEQFSMICTCGHYVTRFYAERPTDADVVELRRRFDNHVCSKDSGQVPEKIREREYIRNQFHLFDWR
jgi:hypothetical protein